MDTSTIIRSRWAAVGAAVAVTLGAGGLASVSADSPESTFVSVTPTRVLDTRADVGLAGAVVGSQPRDLDVVGPVDVVLPDGTAGTDTVVPDGATAIVANLTAVRPTSTGYVSIRPGDATGIPTTSNINVPTAGGIYPNSVTVEVAGDGTVDLFYFADVAGGTTDLLLDIVGYYLEGAGVPGPQGEPGPQGVPGPQGPAGPADSIVRLSSDVEVANGTFATAIAECEPNEVATGGGVFWVNIPNSQTPIVGSYPLTGNSDSVAGDTPDGWKGEVHNTSGFQKTFRVYAICAPSVVP